MGCCVRFAHAEGDVSTLEGAFTVGVAWRGASLALATAHPREARPTKGGGVLGNDLQELHRTSVGSG